VGRREDARPLPADLPLSSSSASRHALGSEWVASARSAGRVTANTSALAPVYQVVGVGFRPLIRTRTIWCPLHQRRIIVALSPDDPVP